MKDYNSCLSTDVNRLKNDEFRNCAWLSTAEEVAIDRCTQGAFSGFCEGISVDRLFGAVDRGFETSALRL
ncbi:hypothetical protein Taro_001062 [Colocasia esculenta]|uniref:Uncharacterized protein n=1 Tax=Colocasia esculenta TaxID=4460 RepID=A0A843TH09_COLES|nr:hypothetical protein [Colocasia esculenta]